jgi:hypothetical protein
VSAVILALAMLGLAWPVIRAVIAHMRKAEARGQARKA